MEDESSFLTQLKGLDKDLGTVAVSSPLFSKVTLNSVIIGPIALAI